MPTYDLDDLDDIERLCEVIYEIDRMPGYWKEHLIHLLPEARLIVERLEATFRAQGATFRRPVR